MTGPTSADGDALEHARRLLTEAEDADHDRRLELLNDLHRVLEGELDEQAPPPGR